MGLEVHILEIMTIKNFIFESSRNSDFYDFIWISSGASTKEKAFNNRFNNNRWHRNPVGCGP